MALYAIHYHFIEGYQNGGPVGGWDESGHSYFPNGAAKGSMVMAGRPPGFEWVSYVHARAETPSAYNGVWSGVESNKSLEEAVDTLRAQFFSQNTPMTPAPEQVESPGPTEQESELGGPAATSAPAQRFVSAQSWWIAAQLARRHPAYVVHEMHPADGMYDCLALLRVRTRSSPPRSIIQLNRVGRIHVDESASFKLTWNEVFSTDDPSDVVKRIEAAAGLPQVTHAPAATRRTLTYRFIASLMNLTVNSRHRWDARNEFIDSSDWDAKELNGYLDSFPEVVETMRTSTEIGIFHEPESHFWGLLRDSRVVALVSLEGRLFLHDGSVDLMASFLAKNRNIDQVVLSTLRSLI